MFEIVRSLIIIIFISSSTGGVSYYYFNGSFTGSFILTTIIQLSIAWYIKTYLSYRERKSVTELQQQMLTQIEQEATQAPCSHCGETNLIPISPQGDNDFVCLSCDQKNSVYVNITIAQPTVPVDAMQYEVTNFNESYRDVENKILKDDEIAR